MSSWLGNWLGAENNTFKIGEDFDDGIGVMEGNECVSFVLILRLRWKRKVLDRSVFLEELKNLVC
jgi:hypothetical protein